MNQKIAGMLENLPDQPGVYFMKDDRDTILYVGKAKSLKKRVRQYFQNSRSMDMKTRSLVSQIEDIEYIVTGTELEALILECNMIKKHRPKYNILLKDDKHYPYIRVTMEEDYPRITIARDMKKDGSRYFGPYRNSYAIKQTIEAINRLFPIRTCSRDISSSRAADRPCLNFHIGKCLAPCQGNIDREEYRDMVKQICLFLGNRLEQLAQALEVEMKRASQTLDYEKAARLRDQISSVRSIAEKQRVITTSMEDQDVIAFARDGDGACVQVFFIRNGKLLGGEHYFVEEIDGIKAGELMTEFVKRFYSATAFVPEEILVQNRIEEALIIEQWLRQKKGSRVKIKAPLRGDKKKVVNLAAENAAEALKNYGDRIKREREEAHDALSQLHTALDLEEFPYRIEAFDISNIQGVDPVGSMVVFEEARPKKSDYRRYRINMVQGPDDYSSMKEIIRRRYRRFVDGGLDMLPQLILVDGGRGQVSAAETVLEELGIKVQVCGMVKDDRHRTRGVIKNGEEISLLHANKAFQLVAAIQEEAHRFAVSYHRTLRRTRQVKSQLDQIDGIGEKRRTALLKHFGSIDAIKEADVEELAGVRGMSRRAAQEVYSYFHNE